MLLFQQHYCFQRKSGKGSKAAAKTSLQKQDQVGRNIFFRLGDPDDTSDQKSADQVCKKSHKREISPYGDRTEHIPEHGTKCAAETNKYVSVHSGYLLQMIILYLGIYCKYTPGYSIIFSRKKFERY